MAQQLKVFVALAEDQTRIWFSAHVCTCTTHIHTHPQIPTHAHTYTYIHTERGLQLSRTPVPRDLAPTASSSHT